MNTDTPPSASVVARALLGGLAVVLVVVGQFVLSLAPDLLGWGWVITGLGLALFLASRLRPPPHWLTNRLAARLTVQDLWVLPAVALNLLATGLSLAFQRYDQTNYLPVLQQPGAAI